MSESKKKQLIIKLIEHYGKDFKTPLAKDLGVNVSTVRRMFNGNKPIKTRYIRGINNILGDKISKRIK